MTTVNEYESNIYHTALLVDFCNVLNVPVDTPTYLLQNIYNDVKDKWEPTKFINDPNKYFVALEISSKLDNAYDTVKSVLAQRSTENIDIKIDNQHIRTCNISDIPTYGGLTTIAFILGFGVLGGVALGSYFTLKRLIAKGDYNAALNKSSDHFKTLMLIIFGGPAFIIFLIFAGPWLLR